MTGWGQSGPLSQVAGHDLNYLALSGALSLGCATGGTTWAPPVLLGDMGGGGLMLALGIVSGILEARTSGKGQVGRCRDHRRLCVAHHCSFTRSKAAGVWQGPGHRTRLIVGAVLRIVYRCADGKWISLVLSTPVLRAAAAEMRIPTEVAPWSNGTWSNGPPSRPTSLRSSRCIRVTNGAACLKAATSVLRQYSIWMKHLSMRITELAARSSKSMESRSPRRRPGSAARPRRSSARRLLRALLTTRLFRTGDLQTMTSPRYAALAYSNRRSSSAKAPLPRLNDGSVSCSPKAHRG